jgi:hypothetical protein
LTGSALDYGYSRMTMGVGGDGGGAAATGGGPLTVGQLINLPMQEPSFAKQLGMLALATALGGGRWWHQQQHSRRRPGRPQQGVTSSLEAPGGSDRHPGLDA